jgi:hypothetical protein
MDFSVAASRVCQLHKLDEAMEEKKGADEKEVECPKKVVRHSKK